MAQFSVIPVFPPRADVQVGDVYMSCDDAGQDTTSSAKLDHKSLWLASVDGIMSGTSGGKATPGLLETQYMSRVHMPVKPVGTAASATTPPAKATPDADAGKPPDAKAKAPVKPAKPGIKPVAAKPASAKPAAAQRVVTPPASTAASDVFVRAPLRELMPVSLPEFFSVSATRAQAQALVPFPSILARAGLSYDKAQNIEISVPEAESYGVPVANVYRLFDAQQCGSNANLLEAFQIYEAVAPKFCQFGTPAMVLISEVFATRAINVSVTFSVDVSAQAAVGLSYASGTAQATVLNALSKLVSPAPASGTSDATAVTLMPTPASGASAPTIEQATAYVTQLNELYQQLGASNAPQQYPGVQVSVIHGNGSGVVLSRQFDSPVVIGFRGVRVTPPTVKECAARAASMSTGAAQTVVHQ
ncbi:hypothetical protein PQR39_41380 [Paraburkholderia sediminicola]|uniref:hypothetical protein n=1 Tax=Paraburkholderia sediminicola TaxID=458836 RepID=UPI0038BC32BB